MLVRWTWCGDEGDACNCLGVARFGHSGEIEMYADDSKFFREHREVMKWVNKETRGAFTCDAATFGDVDPFPGHKKLCQCASGLGAEIFAPFARDDASETAEERANRDAAVATPHVVLASAEEARLGAAPGAVASAARAPRHAYHHTMPRRRGGGPLDALAARDLAGFTAEELRLLHRADEVAAMKAATAAITAAEGELPLLPEEKERTGGTGGLAGLGAAAPGGGAAASFSRPAALVVAGAGAAVAAAAVVAAKRRTAMSPDEDQRLTTGRYDVYL